MMFETIDVWDVETFDTTLIARLEADEALVRNYLTTEHEITLAHDLGRGPGRSIMRPENRYSVAFYDLQAAIGREMETRTIRVWHYTRLTDAEVGVLRRDGVHLSTPTTLRARFAMLVEAGDLTVETAERLYAGSPFHSDQLKARQGKFWMTSHPTAIDDGDVEQLLAHWGGEVTSMWTHDPGLLVQLAKIGAPRVIELAVAMAFTRHSHCAGSAVVATFGRALGCIPEKHAFDLYAVGPLPPGVVEAVHTKGEPAFAALGRGYPERFVDVAIGRWRELTGEDD